MSHNLMIQNGEASMMYVGGVPWHGLGTALDKPATAEEAIQAARLDWQVKKLPLYATDGDNSLLRLPVPDKFAVARENSLDVLRRCGQQLHHRPEPGGVCLLRSHRGTERRHLPHGRCSGQRRAGVDLSQTARFHPGGRRRHHR